MRYTSIWEFEVAEGREAEFLAHYRPAGTWAELFRRAPGYLGTELLSDPAKARRFVTMDRWVSREAFEAFKEAFGDEYQALDARCAGLTTHEASLGAHVACREALSHPALRDSKATADSRVTIHMATSLDGYIARKDGSVDWLETSDEFADGETLSPEFVAAFLGTIDCYVMGSRTYETALRFEAQGLGWAYADTPTFVLTRRSLPRTRDNVEFYAGDLALFVNGHLRPRFRNIWFVGGGMVSAECLRLRLADEVSYSILPILIGDGIAFCEGLDRDVALHLAEIRADRNGIVEVRYDVRGERSR